MSIFVSLTGQYGTAGGTLYDPATMQPLYNTTAMAEAVRIWRALMDTSYVPQPNSTQCERPSEAYYLRNCAWGFSLATFWKLFDFAFDGYLRGRIATTVLPGSHRVLDRTTGRYSRGHFRDAGMPDMDGGCSNRAVLPCSRQQATQSRLHCLRCVCWLD